MHKLPETMALFGKYGKSETPVAIIRNGTMPDKKIAFGRVNTIVDLANRQAVSSPAIVVMGEVAGLATKSFSTEEQRAGIIHYPA